MPRRPHAAADTLALPTLHSVGISTAVVADSITRAAQSHGRGGLRAVKTGRPDGWCAHA